MRSDLNGCISNLLVNTGNYSLTWNSDYPMGAIRDMTQNNVDVRYYHLNSTSIDDLTYDLLHIYDFSDKSGLGKLRPIIEFRE